MPRLTILLVAALSCACSSQPTIKNDLYSGPALTHWPAAPGQERIQLIRAFSSPSELGYREGFSARFKNFLGGSNQSRLVRPYAIDEDERWLVIADAGAGLVFCLDKDRQKYSVIGASESLVLSSPVGVALGDNALYVADSALGKVFKFDHRQRLISTMEQFSRPTSLAYDHENRRLYITDTTNHNILVLDEQGRIVQKIGSRGTRENEFNYPSHIALTPDRLLVVDALNFRVQILSRQGDYLDSFGIHGDKPGHFAQPKGISTDPDGHIYIAESMSGLIQIFDVDGTFLLAFGGKGSEPGNLMLPAGIHIEGDRIFVADSGNGRIQVFKYLGAP